VSDIYDDLDDVPDDTPLEPDGDDSVPPEDRPEGLTALELVMSLGGPSSGATGLCKPLA
jgi:hypothetical protein